MKSLERRFNQLVEKHSGWSTYACFAAAVRHQRFNIRVIKTWFARLVDKIDFEEGDRRALYSNLQVLTIEPEACTEVASISRRSDEDEPA